MEKLSGEPSQFSGVGVHFTIKLNPLNPIFFTSDYF